MNRLWQLIHDANNLEMDECLQRAIYEQVQETGHTLVYNEKSDTFVAIPTCNISCDRKHFLNRQHGVSHE